MSNIQPLHLLSRHEEEEQTYNRGMNDGYRRNPPSFFGASYLFPAYIDGYKQGMDDREEDDPCGS